MSSTGFFARQTLREQARWLANAALDLLFPPRCVACQRMGTLLCNDCQASFKPLLGPVCDICATPSTTHGKCAQCARRNTTLQAISSAFFYTGTVQEAIIAFKYKRRRALAEPLANSISNTISHPGTGWSLCAVPLHHSRLSARGFNQSELLVKQLSLTWDLPILASSSLIRTRKTVQQITLGPRERQQNVSGAFAADRAVVEGNAILLVDDVCTTGATLFACAQALSDAGASTIRAVTLARTPPSQHQ
jgi:ComF family protein